MRRARTYGLPETTEYQDDGCDYAPSCLECPFSVCRYDDPHMVHSRSPRAVRYRQIFRLRKAGMPVREIKRQLKVAETTVYRAIRNGGVMKLPEHIEEQRELPNLDPVKLKPHNFKLAKPPSISHPGYAIYIKACSHCAGDVEFNAPTLSARCLQCSRRWGKAS